MSTMTGSTSASANHSTSNGCCSTHCPHFSECANACINIPNDCIVENWYDFGSVTVYTDEEGNQHLESQYFCGPRGNYRKFVRKQ